MLPRFSFPILGASLIFALTAVPNPASAQVTFSTSTHSGNSLLWNYNNPALRADLNGDGREDFIAPSPTSCSGSFSVTLSTGDGSYSAPVCYTLPAGNYAIGLAVGDFYGNGSLDLAIGNDLGDLYIYRNEGNGTLAVAASRTLPGGCAVNLAADVNHDGHIDLICELSNSNGGGTLNVLLGNGDGTFTTGPTTIFTNMKEPAGPLALGDFDDDGIADIVVTGASQEEAAILYGDDKGDFTAGPDIGNTKAALTRYQPFDADSGGTMELIGTPYTYTNPSFAIPTFFNYLDLEWGHSNRTLTSQKVPLKSCAISNAPPQIGDFDGDGIADLIVAEDSDCKGDGPYTFNFMKGTGNGIFQPEQVIYSTADQISEWHVMRASHSSKPDLVVFQFLDVNNTITSPEDLVLVNTTSGNFPACTPLNSKPTGINVCGLTSTVVPAGPVNFSFAGSNQTPGRDMELWIDGKKVAEDLKNTYSYYDFLGSTQTLSAGTHEIGIFSVGWDYSLLLDLIPLNVGSATCPVPGSTGLNVCAPIQNSTVGSPITAWAAGNAGGPITRMEVWVDGVKEYSTFGSNTLKTQLTVAPGWHQFAYFLVSINGTKWLDIVYAQVQ